MTRNRKLSIQLPLMESMLLTLVIIYLILTYGTPFLTRLILKTDRWLPMPGTLSLMFMILTLIGVFIHVTTSDERIKEFMRPLLTFLRGDQGKNWTVWARGARLIGLIALPILLGSFVYIQMKPSIAPPATLRIQHPTIPGAFEKITNPFRAPDGMLKDLKILEEGQVLYQKNCRPCHGTTAGGNGPMAWGFRLKPINFQDPGTIATLVEGYLVWRIKEGGIGLPPVSTPWDSAMPSWKDELTDEEIWKIIVAEYDTAGIQPRKPEKLE